MNKKLIISIILLVALVGGAWWLFSREDTSVTYEVLIEEENAVLVVDQPAGDETVVSYAKLSEPGYVLIYATNTETGQKELIGSSELLPAGEHKNVKVRSKRGTNERAAKYRITAAVVADNGDGEYTEEDTDELLSESEAGVEAETDEAAEDPSELSDEELAELLEDAGYTVVEGDVEADGSMMEEDEIMEGDHMDEGDQTGEEMTHEDDAEMEASVDAEAQVQ